MLRWRVDRALQSTKVGNHPETSALVEIISTAVWSWASNVTFLSLVSVHVKWESQKTSCERCSFNGTYILWECGKLSYTALGNFCGAIKQVSDKLLPQGSLIFFKSSQWFQHPNYGQKDTKMLFLKRMKDFLITFYHFICVTRCGCLIKSLV